MNRDDFEAWIFSIDSYLAELNELVPEIYKDLDFSPSSLSILEGYLLERFSSVEEILAEENKHLLNACSVYVGETFRKHQGGNWDIILDDEKNAFYNLPILRNEVLGEDCPLTFITASIDRKKGNPANKALQTESCCACRLSAQRSVLVN